MTKKIFAFALTLTFTILTHAQVLTSFPTEKDKFIKVMEQEMKATKSDNLSQVDDDFNKVVKDGLITDAQVKEIIGTLNILAPRNLSAFPYYYNFLITVTNIAKSKIGADKLTNWLKVCGDLAQGQKKGDNHDLTKFLEFSVSLFEFNAMHHSQARTWRSDAAYYTLALENGKPVLSYPTGRLMGSTNEDTLFINNTSGKYYPTENKWYGKGGRVDWSRNKLSPDNVYANFKSNYTINFDNASYTIDSVEFFYKEFFQTPLHGTFTDKFVPSRNDSAATYPRFSSSARNVTLKNIVPHADYTGGFGLWGPKVMGVGVPDSPAAVTFYRKDKKRIITAFSQSFAIKKGEDISSPKTEVMIYIDNDTIYHPQLNFTYKAKSNEIKMLRGESGISKSKFFDSYHNHEFETDAIIWNLDSTRIELRTLNGVGKVGATFESYNYFNRERVKIIQGGAPYEPLSIIKRQYEKTKSKELNAGELAKAIDPHLSEEQAKALYYELVEMGFIKYDEAAGIVTMRDKVVHYVLSYSKKVDYDQLRIKSIPKDGVNYIELKDNVIDLTGVSSVLLSDTAEVAIFPARKDLKLEKDRGMQFDGLVYGGRLDFFGKDYRFKYAPFTIDLNDLDSMRINIPDGDKVDEFGKPKLKTILTDIVGVKGTLEIDAPINKSGRTHLYQFPKLTSVKNSYASYDDPNIAGGAYHRKDFYFEIEPFKLDSLNAFTPSAINWPGKLVSGGIFADIKQNLHIMPDLALGFEMNTPDNGLALYKDGSQYTGGLTLNHYGLTAKGKINHYTAMFTSNDILFCMDSTHATADSLHIDKSASGVNTPEVSNTGAHVFWTPKNDSMMIYMRNNPFSMYENETKLKGNLLLRGTGLRGNGVLDWKEASIGSKDFNFKSDFMSADTAELTIRSIKDGRVTFNAPNISAKVNFKARDANFKTNSPDVPTHLAYNNYNTTIGEFRWDIDNKRIDFEVPNSTEPQFFTSTRESQMGLKFQAKRASYDLETSTLRIQQVPFIYVADAKVVPDSGIVVIQADARMDQLTNATIYVDTATSRHKITSCTVNIISKAELRGSGNYSFSCEGHKDEKIVFNDIKCTKETIEGDKKKGEFNEYSLGAKGNITDSGTFFIYPRVTYRGEAYLFGKNPYLFMKGYARINLTNPDVTTTDFKIIDDINPDTLFLHYDSATRSSIGSRLVTGIYFNKAGELPAMYHGLFTVMENQSDLCMFKAPGVVTYNTKTNEYVIGDEDKIKKGVLPGNQLTYNDEKGIMKGIGEMSLGADFGLIKYKAVGTMEADVKKKIYKFNMTLGINIRTDNKALDDKFQQLMFADNTDLPDINYEGDKFKAIYSNIADEKMVKDLETAPMFKRPKDYNYNLVFSGVNFIYDPDDLTLRSYGKVGVAFVGEKGIHKRLDGYIEVGLKNNNLNIYLKTGANEWFYIEYKPGSLGLISSYDDYNKIVGTIIMTPAEKRKITGENGKTLTVFLGSSINKGAFLDAMKEKVNPLLPMEKINPKPVHPKDTSIHHAPRGGDAPVVDSTKAGGADDPNSAAGRRAAQLKKEAGQSDTSKPAAVDTSAVKLSTPDATKPAVDSAAVIQPAPQENKPAPEEPKQPPTETKPAPSETKPTSDETKSAPAESKPATDPATNTTTAPAETKPTPVETKSAPPESKPEAAPATTTPAESKPAAEQPATQPVVTPAAKPTTPPAAAAQPTAKPDAPADKPADAAPDTRTQQQKDLDAMAAARKRAMFVKDSIAKQNAAPADGSNPK